jgi:hypothetical protein
MPLVDYGSGLFHSEDFYGVLFASGEGKKNIEFRLGFSIVYQSSAQML